MCCRIEDLHMIVMKQELRDKIEDFFVSSKDNLQRTLLDGYKHDQNVLHFQMQLAYSDISSLFINSVKKWSIDYGVSEDLIKMYATLDLFFQPILYKASGNRHFVFPDINSKLRLSLNGKEQITGNVISLAHSKEMYYLIDYLDNSYDVLPRSTQKYLDSKRFFKRRQD